ncbi:MAG: calcium/sodium antiporter [Gudongella sp.]|nr:calcium/sodium antiporter [Gudongella sp.]
MNEFLLSLFESFPLIVLLAIIGLFLLSLGKGADILIDQAVILSGYLKIPKAIMGATIISLGTTLPELSVSTMAAIGGNPGLALGNAVGSIITNAALIIGLSAMIRPIDIDPKNIKVQSWVKLGAASLLVLFSLPFFASDDIGKIPQIGGFIFVGMLVIYLYWSYKESKRYAFMEEENLEENVTNKMVVEKLLLIIVGMVIVIFSSKVLIPAVEISAIRVGIPQAVIAATLVAFGTSLPELTTSIKAVLKGYGELAVGNIVGANILNILFVIGVSAAVTPRGLLVPEIFYRVHFPAMVLILILFKLFTSKKATIIGRRQGFLLFVIYLLYLGANLAIKA